MRNKPVSQLKLKLKIPFLDSLVERDSKGRLTSYKFIIIIIIIIINIIIIIIIIITIIIIIINYFILFFSYRKPTHNEQ